MMKKVKLSVALMGILAAFMFTGCADGTKDINNAARDLTGDVNAGIERMMDTDNDYGYDDSIKSGIHTNPEYSGGAYGGGYANVGK